MEIITFTCSCSNRYAQNGKYFMGSASSCALCGEDCKYCDGKICLTPQELEAEHQNGRGYLYYEAEK